MSNICKINNADCGRYYAKEMCSFHYSRAFRGADVAAPKYKPDVNKGMDCNFEDCSRQSVTKGLCHTHDMQMRTRGYMSPIWSKEKPGCSARSCDRSATKKGLCDFHYARKRRGIPLDAPVNNRRGRHVAVNRMPGSEGVTGDIPCAQGCGKPAVREWYCADHQLARDRGGRSVSVIGTELNWKPCEVNGCSKMSSLRFPACSTCRNRAKRFGMTQNELIDLMLDASCHGCGSKIGLHIDHDHRCCPEAGRSCGKCIRGTLCSACNSILGLAGDSTETLVNLMDYLLASDPLHPANPDLTHADKTVQE